MTERLTERDCNGIVGFKGLMRYYNFNDFQKMAKKLLYYEDLEEQGRLVVLPEGFKEKIAAKHCPHIIDLKDIGCEVGESVKVTDCLDCWTKALKGE